MSSIGVDPAPFYRRLYDPAEPWTLPPAEQEAYTCVIGRDYPAPIVDHRRERGRALDRYRAVGRA